MGFASISEADMPDAFARLVESVRLYCPQALWMA